jgi:hypothetical protein
MVPLVPAQRTPPGLAHNAVTAIPASPEATQVRPLSIDARMPLDVPANTFACDGNANPLTVVAEFVALHERPASLDRNRPVVVPARIISPVSWRIDITGCVGRPAVTGVHDPPKSVVRKIPSPPVPAQPKPLEMEKEMQ